LAAYSNAPAVTSFQVTATSQDRKIKN
jgi:hypothetical protein